MKSNEILLVNYAKRKETKYYNRLDVINVPDEKEFWKTIKPFLTKKIRSKKSLLNVIKEKVKKKIKKK